MKWNEFLQLLFFIIALVGLSPFFGGYIAGILGDSNEKRNRWIFWPLRRLEIGVYQWTGIDPEKSMDWKSYAVALLAFHAVGIIFLMVLQMTQGWWPFNPKHLPHVPWSLAFNTAVSFVTNTNWQSYAGEVTMSPFTQMVGLATQNFLSAACGVSVAIALIRGLRSKSSSNLGHFGADITRLTIYVLLPISFFYALFLVNQGVIQSLSPAFEAKTLEGLTQTIPLGPVASQVAIKMLGTNGGGFFNANGAHPFENPTALSNFVQLVSIFLIGAALTSTFGIMTGARRQGWLLFSVMTTLFLVLTGLSLVSEWTFNPAFQLSGLMEGKEIRFGVFNSLLFSNVTTMASCGAINATMSSLSPLSGGIALLNMMLGEIIFGGVGSGLYGMLLFVILTIFLCGLMVGRSPEYMGKKIEAGEMAMVIIAILAPCAAILVGTAVSILTPGALASLSSGGPHGFSELLYAFTSAASNNGSAFAGLNANTPFFNLGLALAMLIGRLGVMVPVLSIAGRLSTKKISAVTQGTFETDTFLFGCLLIAVILIVGALTFLPSLVLGPLVEHMMMLKGQLF